MHSHATVGCAQVGRLKTSRTVGQKRTGTGTVGMISVQSLFFTYRTKSPIKVFDAANALNALRSPRSSITDLEASRIHGSKVRVRTALRPNPQHSRT